MDESSLEAAIETYNAQLQQVESALGTDGDASQQADLLRLKDDLKQLIELTESSLVSVKKSRLLASLEEACGPQSAGTAQGTDGGGLDDEFAAFYAEVGEASQGVALSSQTASSSSPVESNKVNDEEEEEEEEEDVECMSGLKVQAPYRTSWGTLEYHNAMVVGAEEVEGAETHVRVLYVHPTHKSMKACPFFLEDRCRFKDDCRFSHGEVVSVSELRAFQEPDLSKLQEGSSCLARHEDGIWYPAQITEIDSGYYTVKYDSLLQKDLVVEADGIIPPLREDDPYSSDSEDDDDSECAAFAKVVDSTELEKCVTNQESVFGGWEVYTRGIGSKLMAKMGYEFGKGLGRNGEGRVEPVMAVVLPKGKSLDRCVEIGQKRAVRKCGTETAPKRKRRTPKGTGKVRARHDVFDFLNSKLGDREHKAPLGVEASAVQRNSKEAYRGSHSIKRSINVRLFQTTEQVAQTKREIERLTQAIARQAGRDKTVVNHLEEKLTSAQRLLTQLKAQERTIQTEKSKANTHKKMTEF